MKLVLFNQQAFPVRSFSRAEHDRLSVRVHFTDGQSHYQIFPHESQAKRAFEKLLKDIQSTKE